MPSDKRGSSVSQGCAGTGAGTVAHTIMVVKNLPGEQPCAGGAGGSATPRQVLWGGMERRSRGRSLLGPGHLSRSIPFYSLWLEVFLKNQKIQPQRTCVGFSAGGTASLPGTSASRTVRYKGLIVPVVGEGGDGGSLLGVGPAAPALPSGTQRWDPDRVFLSLTLVQLCSLQHFMVLQALPYP